MRPHRPKDPFGAELRRFADNIDLRQFRPLSPGIGLGQIRRPDPVAGLSKPYSFGTKDDPYAPPAVSAIPERAPTADSSMLSLRRLFPAKEVHVPQPTPQMHRVGDLNTYTSPARSVVATDHAVPPRPSNLMVRAIKMLVGHGVDILTVVLSLVVAVFIGGYFLGPDATNIFTRVLKWAPVTELTRLSLMELAVGVYFLFGVYWAFFRLVVGFTVGQGLLRPAAKNLPGSEVIAEMR